MSLEKTAIWNAHKRRRPVVPPVTVGAPEDTDEAQALPAGGAFPRSCPSPSVSRASDATGSSTCANQTPAVFIPFKLSALTYAKILRDPDKSKVPVRTEYEQRPRFGHCFVLKEGADGRARSSRRARRLDGLTWIASKGRALAWDLPAEPDGSHRDECIMVTYCKRRTPTSFRKDAYHFFSDAIWSQLKTERPGLSGNRLKEEVKRRWQALPAHARQVYKAREAVEERAYLRNILAADPSSLLVRYEYELLNRRDLDSHAETSAAGASSMPTASGANTAGERVRVIHYLGEHAFECLCIPPVGATLDSSEDSSAVHHVETRELRVNLGIDLVRDRQFDVRPHADRAAALTIAQLAGVGVDFPPGSSSPSTLALPSPATFMPSPLSAAQPPPPGWGLEPRAPGAQLCGKRALQDIDEASPSGASGDWTADEVDDDPDDHRADELDNSSADDGHWH